MNKEELKQLLMNAAGMSSNDAGEQANSMWTAMSVAGITSVKAQTAFIAQTYHETKGFTKFRELYSSTPENLLKLVNTAKRGPETGITDLESAKKYFGADGQLDRTKFYDKFYAKESLGLGNKGGHDGSSFIGRGDLQVTGRYNYQKADDYFHKNYEKFTSYWTDQGKTPPKPEDINFLKNPELLEQRPFSSIAGAQHWENAGLNKLAEGLDMNKSMNEEPNKSILDEMSRIVNVGPGGSLENVIHRNERKGIWNKLRKESNSITRNGQLAEINAQIGSSVQKVAGNISGSK